MLGSVSWDGEQGTGGMESYGFRLARLRNDVRTWHLIMAFCIAHCFSPLMLCGSRAICLWDASLTSRYFCVRYGERILEAHFAVL